MSVVILTPTTSAAQSSAIRLGDHETVTLVCPGLAGVETAQLQISYDEGTTYVDYYDRDGVAQFTATCNALLVEGPGTFRVDKDASVASVGVYVAGFVQGL